MPQPGLLRSPAATGAMCFKVTGNRSGSSRAGKDSPCIRTGSQRSTRHALMTGLGARIASAESASTRSAGTPIARKWEAVAAVRNCSKPQFRNPFHISGPAMMVLSAIPTRRMHSQLLGRMAPTLFHLKVQFRHEQAPPPLGRDG
jgi:hypothetical protein